MNESSFIEDQRVFPINKVNEASEREKQVGARPDHWEMVFWWTRKPLIGARAVIAGALLPNDVHPLNFSNYIRLNSKTAHRENPTIPPAWRDYFARAKLLDPFAGFGSIPLEAARLGIGEVVASELLPTAYVFLKAILEYPKWITEQKTGGKGESLAEGEKKVSFADELKSIGEDVVKRLREDQDIKELYDDDVAVYIGSWEVKCPHCGKWTPLVGNWWLARVPKGATEEEEGEEEEGTKSGEFERIAWMEPVKVGERIFIKVVDLNKELGEGSIRAKINTRQSLITVGDKRYTVPKSNVDAKHENAICLHCGNPILKGKEGWYVKEALREWNQRVEQYLSGQLDLQGLINESRARPTILVKVNVADGGLEFQPATQEDQEKLWKALEKLRKIWGDPDIPNESFAPYQMGTAGAFRITLWGFDKFYKLFNPRQLLTLVKLVKLIREAGKRVEEEKLREGWSKEKAHKYAEAITTYLAIALARFVVHNNIVTLLHPSSALGIDIEHAFSMRGIAMTWNWGDTNPFIATRGVLLTNSLIKCLEKEIDGLEYIVNAVSNSVSKISVIIDDATSLSKLGDEKFDLIVTDPPYKDDVPYTELSDFYYVWLKRALSDVVDVGGLTVRRPRFLPEAFYMDGAEIETQWKQLALKEVSENEGRLSYFKKDVNGFEYFKDLLAKSFERMAFRLKDDGLLVTYYSHTSPEAWEALLDAGWRGAGLRITAAYVLATESKQRVTARGKTGLDVSVLAVWRKSTAGERLASEAYAEALEKCKDHAKSLQVAGLEGVNLFVGTLGCILSAFTKYARIVGVKDTAQLVKDYIYPATAEAIALSLAEKEEQQKERLGLSGPSLFYLLSKVLLSRKPGQPARTMDRSTLTIMAIGTRNEMNELTRIKVVRKEKDKFLLLEPTWGRGDLLSSVKDVLGAKGINKDNPMVRTAVDMLHILEYYALALPTEEFKARAEELRAKQPAFYNEAILLAKALRGISLDHDPEGELLSRLVNILESTRSGLDV